jgi:hypothetical protein
MNIAAAPGEAERAFALLARNVALAPAEERLPALLTAAGSLRQHVAAGRLNAVAVSDRIIEVAELHDLAERVEISEIARPDTMEAEIGSGEEPIFEPEPDVDESEVNEASPVSRSASAALASWDRTLTNLENPEFRIPKYMEAVTEVLRLAKFEGSPTQRQQLIDDLYKMGVRHGVSEADVQAHMAAITRGVDPRHAVTAIPNDGAPLASFDDYGAHDFGTTPAASGRALSLTYFDDCGAYAAKRWILKGILALGETSAWIAPPGAGKSALLTEIAKHAAGGIDWRGHRSKMACGVVVLALERGDLFKRRLQVYHLRDGLTGLPIAVADAVIDLLNPACVEIIVATVRAAEEAFGCAVGLIILDTYAKGIAANGGDEDKARDQNRAAANLRNVHAQLKVHIALVGHTGKNEERGARGSNAHVGDVDVMIQISGDEIKVAQVIKGNDQPERAVARFKLEAFELGRDEDGDPITTAIVTNEDLGDAPAQKAREPKLTPNQKTMFGMLHDAGKGGLLLEDWNNQAKEAGIGIKRKADLTDIRNALLAKGMIRTYGERWHVVHA